MSMVHKEEIICPKCQAHGEFNIWESVNLDLNPELREAIFNDDLFIYTCPKCGHKTCVPYDTLYHDMKHKFMILFNFFEQDDFNYDPYEIPLLPNSMEDYTFRHVNGLWELKEKILILEKGLNDVAIERMKYCITHYECPELSEMDIKLYFGDVIYNIPEYLDGVIVFFYYDENNQPQRHYYQMREYHEQFLACDLDPRMKVKGCETVDAGWISLKLSGKATKEKKLVQDPIEGHHGKYEDGKWGLADKDDHHVSTFDYNFVGEWGEGHFKVEKGAKKNILRPDGSLVLSEWYNDVFKVEQGYFIFGNTIRRSKNNPRTKYMRGIGHINGDIVFPMVADYAHWLEGNIGIIVEIEKSPYIFTMLGGIFDPKSINNNEEE